MLKDRYVYGINDEYGIPCYIGVGKGNRMHHHMLRAKTSPELYGNSAKHVFFVACLARGFEPIPYKIAENLTIEKAKNYERILIALYGRRDLGTGSLLNSSAGGDGVRNMSAATRAKISVRTREAMADPTLRAYLSAKNDERWANPEERLKVSIQVRDLWATEKGRAAFTSKNMDKWTPEKRAEQAKRTLKQLAESGNPFQGKKHSAESRQKMSEQIWSPERRAAQSERMRKQHADPESKARLCKWYNSSKSISEGIALT